MIDCMNDARNAVRRNTVIRNRFHEEISRTKERNATLQHTTMESLDQWIWTPLTGRSTIDEALNALIVERKDTSRSSAAAHRGRTTANNGRRSPNHRTRSP